MLENKFNIGQEQQSSPKQRELRHEILVQWEGSRV